MLIAAHGNSLRALVKYLDNVSEEEIVELNIPTGEGWRGEGWAEGGIGGHWQGAWLGGAFGVRTAWPALTSIPPPPPPAPGVPLVYELDADLKPVRHYYLGDADEVAKKAAAVAAQGSAK